MGGNGRARLRWLHSVRNHPDKGEGGLTDNVIPLTNAELDQDIEQRDLLGPGFKRTNTNELMAEKFPPLKAIVEGYLYGGFTVLAGRQKLGKTWLGIDWAVAVGTGGVAMGSPSTVFRAMFFTSTLRTDRAAFSRALNSLSIRSMVARYVAARMGDRKPRNSIAGFWIGWSVGGCLSKTRD